MFFISDISQYSAKYSRNGNKNKLAKYKSGVLSGDILVKVFVRLTEAAAESLEPDVPETVCDTIKKLDFKDIPKLSVAARTSLFSECLLQDVIS